MEVGPISPGAWGKLADYLTGAGVLAALLGAAKLYLSRNRPAADTRYVDAQADAQHATADATRADTDLKIVREVYALHRDEIERAHRRIAELEAEREANRDTVLLAREIVRQEAERPKQLEGGPGEG